MKRQAVVIGLLLLALAGSFAIARAGSSAPEDVAQAEAELEQVVVQLQELDGRLSLAVDAYNGTTLKLDRIYTTLDVTSEHLQLAKQSSRSARRTLKERLVALYKADDEGALEIVLGATSLNDLIDRVDTARRIASLDEQIVLEVKDARKELHQRELRLKRSLTRQEQIVVERSGRRAEIEQMIVERQRLYESKQDEIDRLIAEEAERQERLRREAEQLIAAEAEARRARRAAARAARQSGSGDARSTPPAAPSPAPAPSPSEPPPPLPPPEPSKYPEAVDIAIQYLGIPYRWAGASPQTGFDCSGFTMYVYSKLGVSLPHHAATQYTYGTAVPKANLQPGDLVFFNGLGHNGLYIGGGKFIHSPHTGDVVKISTLSDSWYAATYVGARRL